MQSQSYTYKIIERVFRYLKGNEDYGILFDRNCKLKGFTDSNYGGDDENMCL